MSLLAAVHYDPGSAVSKSTSSLLAMTALDTTNLRVTFTAPANGSVLVRLRGTTVGATTSPQLLLGVLDSTTVRGRAACFCGVVSNAATGQQPVEATTLVTGLTPGTSYTWDASYAVQVVVASTNIKYGGPDDTTTNNSWGGFGFEVWTAETLLAGTHYDPGTAVTNKSTASLLAITAFDTSNLRLVFTAPASGNVMVRLRCPLVGISANSAFGGIQFAVLEGATIRGRARAEMSLGQSAATIGATVLYVNRSRFVVTGLTPGTSYTWDAAYGVDVVAAGGNFCYGGPNDTAGADAYGGFSYDIWDAGATPTAIGQVI